MHVTPPPSEGGNSWPFPGISLKSPLLRYGEVGLIYCGAFPNFMPKWFNYSHPPYSREASRWLRKMRPGVASSLWGNFTLLCIGESAAFPSPRNRLFNHNIWEKREENASCIQSRVWLEWGNRAMFGLDFPWLRCDFQFRVTPTLMKRCEPTDLSTSNKLLASAYWACTSQALC